LNIKGSLCIAVFLCVFCDGMMIFVRFLLEKILNIDISEASDVCAKRMYSLAFFAC
jgi:hypothetical protein